MDSETLVRAGQGSMASVKRETLSDQRQDGFGGELAKARLVRRSQIRVS